eukprot:COSAG04_NODE_286_length_18107_cov_8.810973_1_plen_270_part_00
MAPRGGAAARARIRQQNLREEEERKELSPDETPGQTTSAGAEGSWAYMTVRPLALVYPPRLSKTNPEFAKVLANLKARAAGTWTSSGEVEGRNGAGLCILWNRRSVGLVRYGHNTFNSHAAILVPPSLFGTPTHTAQPSPRLLAIKTLSVRLVYRPTSSPVSLSLFGPESAAQNVSPLTPGCAHRWRLEDIVEAQYLDAETPLVAWPWALTLLLTASKGVLQTAVRPKPNLAAAKPVKGRHQTPGPRRAGFAPGLPRSSCPFFFSQTFL